MKIGTMSSSHLLAAIHFIERQRLMNCIEVYNDKQLGSIDAVEYYAEWPYQYETLIAEAQRRKLIHRYDTDTRKRLEE